LEDSVNCCIFALSMLIEEHPLQPFLPENARMLFLGSFPPPQARWSMNWFYPNWINDFWRIQGLIHFGQKQYFEANSVNADGESLPQKRFDRERIVAFCEREGLAFFDIARKVCRLKDNADDNFLEIIEGTDVFALLRKMPHCHMVITTGGKASEQLCAYFEKQGIEVRVPKVGEKVEVQVPASVGLQVDTVDWWRMPSTSRAYPMKLEKKAAFYHRLFHS